MVRREGDGWKYQFIPKRLNSLLLRRRCRMTCRFDCRCYTEASWVLHFSFRYMSGARCVALSWIVPTPFRIILMEYGPNYSY